RWKWMAVVAGAVFVVSALVIMRLPNEYRARALVMVEPLHPHPDLVVPVISRTLEERVKSVRAQLYARQLMATAIEELKLYPKERDKDGMDAAVDALRNDTEVHPEGDDAFSITVRSRDPVLAAKTANRLAELFIEGNLQVRAGQVTRTRDVIAAQQVDDLRYKLGNARAALTPEHPDMQAYSRELGSAQARLDQARARAAANDLELRRMTDAMARGRKSIGQYQVRIAEIDKLIAA